MTNAIRAGGKYAGLLTLLGDFLKAAIAVCIGLYIATPLLQMVVNASFAGHFSHINGGVPFGLPSIAPPAIVNPLYMGYLCGLCAMIGHLYPIYFKFRGGKGVVCVAAMALVLDWHTAVICISIFLIVLFSTKLMSLASICAAISFPIFTGLLCHWSYYYRSYGADNNALGIPLGAFEVIITSIFAAIIIYKHRANIKRLIKGEENKMVFSKKGK